MHQLLVHCSVAGVRADKANLTMHAVWGVIQVTADADSSHDADTALLQDSQL